MSVEKYFLVDVLAYDRYIKLDIYDRLNIEDHYYSDATI